jgi:hypothetical protein
MSAYPTLARMVEHVIILSMDMNVHVFLDMKELTVTTMKICFLNIK